MRSDVIGRTLMICALALPMTACASGPQPGLTGIYQTWDDVINRWIGAQKDDLYYELGPPTFHPKDLDNGYQELMWDMTIASMPGQAERYNTLPLYTSESCRLVFIADSRGIIKSGHRIGCD